MEEIAKIIRENKQTPSSVYESVEDMLNKPRCIHLYGMLPAENQHSILI
jgi:hypothetical protein